MTTRYANRIAAARAYAGLSRDQLAEQIDMSANTIGRWERGEGAAPKLPVRQALARACNVPEWFLEDGFTALDAADEPVQLPPPPARLRQSPQPKRKSR